MIECPICHVMNDDGAHFCAECGQRFSPAGPPQPPALGTVQPGFSQPPGPQPSYNEPNVPPQSPENQWNQMPNSYNPGPDQPKQPQNNPPEQPKKRLHSPILGGGYEDEPEPEPETRRPRGSARGGGQGMDAPAGKPKHLRSPLLGGDDDDADFDDEPRRPASRPQSKSNKGGLRSPLLGGADEDDDYEEPQARGGFPRRSRDNSADDQQERGSARGLRSPLLGGGSEDADDSAFSSLRRTNRPTGSFPNDRRSKPDVWDPGSDQPGGKPRRLRSSLLGGGDYDDYDDYDDEDEEIADPKALRSPLLRAVTSPHDQPPAGKQTPPQPAPQPYQQAPQPDYSHQQDSSSPLFRQPLTPPQPVNNYAEPVYQQQQMQQPLPQSYPEPAPPPPPPPPPPPQPQQAASPFARNSEPDLVEPAPLRPGLSTSSLPTTVKPSKPARFQPQDEPEISSRPSFDKFASDAPPQGGGGSVSPALAGLVVLAIILKGWNFITYPSMWNQPAYVADQFGQVLVMVALILVVMGVSKGRN